MLSPTKKYHQEISEVLNNIFEHHNQVNVGEGILVPLPKPWPKPKVPFKKLRPIILLNIIRKVLSRMTIERIEPKISQYLSESQSAYRKGRSTTDVVWAYRWILAKVQEYNIKIYVIGIDMSSAFDTIDRKSLLEILERILDEDEVRIIRVLLSNTKLEVRVDGANISAFVSNIGSPQGDSISGPLFEIYFENALKELRNIVLTYKNRSSIPQGTTSLPEEIIYADDCDFLTTKHEEKKYINENVDKILERHNLLVNKDKTENTTLERKKKKGKNRNEDEEWRNQLASSSMNRLKNLWDRKKIGIQKKLKLNTTHYSKKHFNV